MSLVIGFFVIVAGVALLFQLSIKINRKRASQRTSKDMVVTLVSESQKDSRQTSLITDTPFGIEFVKADLEPMEITLPKPILTRKATLIDRPESLY